MAASEKAVKAAYDRGSKGISDAAAANTKAVNAQTAATNAQNTANAALPKAGGTMTGPILLSSLGRLGFTDRYAYFTAVTDGVEDGAFLTVSVAEVSGNFNLSARNTASKIVSLIGTPEGILRWNNKNIVRSVNGVSADAKGNVAIKTDGGISDAVSGVDVAPSQNNNGIKTWTLPNYGTWKVFRADTNTSDVHFYHDTVSGGYTFTAGSTIAGIAVRIA